MYIFFKSIFHIYNYLHFTDTTKFQLKVLKLKKKRMCLKITTEKDIIFIIHIGSGLVSFIQLQLCTQHKL